MADRAQFEENRADQFLEDEADLTHTLLPSSVEVIGDLPQEEGGLIIVDDSLDEAIDEPVENDFDANLAETLDAKTLDVLASDLQFSIEADFESNAPWRDAFKRGMEMLGIDESGARDGAFDAATLLVHPMIAEGAVRFWARSLPEFLPSKGPCKVNIVGRKTEELHNTASSIQSYMNYQMMEEDRAFHAETSKLLFQLPIRGSSFRKTRFDELESTVVGEFVPADEMTCNYSTTNLKTSERFTHTYKIGESQLKMKQLAGVFITAAIPVDTEQDEEESETQDSKDNADFRVHNEESSSHVILQECYVMLDLAGHEHTDENGEPTGLPLPYIVTIAKTEGTILSIYRDYEEDDPMMARCERWTKYDYLPGIGFMGMGFMHLIGTLAETATNLTRILVNGAANASLGGGFKTKNSSLKEDSVTIEPGVWKDVDATFEELSNAFYSPNFERPDSSLLQSLQHIEGVAQRMTSTTEVAMGDANNQAPVGTTIALIEQAMVVDNAIQLNLNAGMTDEMRIRMRMIGEFMEDGEMSFAFQGEEGTVIRDFFLSDQFAIRPSADPAQSSTTKRIATGQMILELSERQPTLYNMPKVHRRLLEAAEVSDIDDLMVSDAPPPPMDPIQENQALLVGKPIQVYPDQHDEAHIAVHMSFMQNPALGAHPLIAEQVTAAMTAHVAEHLSAMYGKQAVALGVPTDPIDQRAEGDEPSVPQNPQKQAAAAQLAASLANQLTNFKGLTPEPQEDPNVEHNMKLQQESEKHQQKMGQEGEKHQLDMAKKMEEATLSSDERVSKMVDDQADREVARDSQRMDATLSELERMRDVSDEGGRAK